MKIVSWESLNPHKQKNLLQRPVRHTHDIVTEKVRKILKAVRNGQDQAVLDLTKKLDKVQLLSLQACEQEIQKAPLKLQNNLKIAINQAYKNISTFHKAQRQPLIEIETMSGVLCQQISRPLHTIGIYIPGGSAPLFSTALMLGVPAQIAGCHRVVLCSPPPISAEILYTATLCGIKEIYCIGGAQAIAAMAYGTETIPNVDKIFGPGNSYVTEAKHQIHNASIGVTIDMPAGPSEVLVIADESADPDFIAADLLSQAEHGSDSQSILVTPCPNIAQQTIQSVQRQCKSLSRADIIKGALKSSRFIIGKSLAQCIDISNLYSPEHLILQTHSPYSNLSKVRNAGSIFLGHYSPESAGDYASGTNHVLPTYGYAKNYSSLGLADFCKRMTIQKLSPKGLESLAPTITAMANAEGLEAHSNAVAIRMNKLRKKK